MKDLEAEEDLNPHHEQQLEYQTLVLTYGKGSKVQHAYYTDEWSRIKDLAMAMEEIDTRIH